jgi:threonine dehydratase
MPDNAPGIKKRAVLSYGAKITECGSSLVAREEALSEILKETGACFIHPYDNAAVISGQGTSALELLKEVPGLEMIVAPVGGGGLLSGTAIAAAGMGRRVTVFGAEPELAQDACQSLLKGRRMPPLPPLTVADGLRTALSDLTFEIIRRDVREILLASESEILAAMKLLWERAKLLVEPSSAVALAPVLKDRERFFGKKIGIILSGGNVELSRINKYF